MSTHKIEATLPVYFQIPGMPDDERESAHPTVEITYNYAPARRAFTPPGEYAPIDPPEPAAVDFVSAQLIDGDGLHPTTEQIQDWASEWLYEEIGYLRAVDAAEDDRRSMRNVL
jgi:hypothetical protein